MTVRIPKPSLVVLIGPSGSGKSTFARRHFLPTEVLSSDACRGLVRDDETDQSATADAFAVLHFIARKRLAAGRLTVVDATSVRREDRKHLIRIAREFHCPAVAIVLNIRPGVCEQRNRGRPDRPFGPDVIRRQAASLRRSLPRLSEEGFSRVHVFETPQEADAATIEREPATSDIPDQDVPPS